ncbi:MAG: hypothetical protein K9N34_02410 [Candidatus Marinimicrobia bacterium]|nr:hypothetical protein [Candidatus Neomarinimicrobiota bacterium]MCF7839743.1 hypothetical protein [Candidatus Neomarinimicrobiota bacterium]
MSALNRITTVLICLLFAGQVWSQETKTFELKTGEKIKGTVVGTDEETGILTVETTYGLVTISPETLVVDSVAVLLKSGEILRGSLLHQNSERMIIQSKLGVLTLSRQEIERVDYLNVTPNQPAVKQLGGGSEKFSFANERQIDVFYDPTGNVLGQNVVYVSGLSWGIGATENLQITSRWADYIQGDFNFRPKIQIHKSGNVDLERSLAIGFDMHARWDSRRYKWHEYQLTAREVSTYNPTVTTGNTKTVYYYDFAPIGTDIILPNPIYYYSNQSGDIINDEVTHLKASRTRYYEVFAAYTLSKMRSEMKGHTAHTIGVSIGKSETAPDLMPRVYYAVGLDVRPNLIVNFEVFWDEYYRESWWDQEYGEKRITIKEPEKPFPLHFDLGFILATDDNFRVGLHYQPLWLAIYLKY